MKWLTTVFILLLSAQACAGDVWFQAYAGKSTYTKDSNPGSLNFDGPGLPGEDWGIAAITNGLNFAFEIGRDLDSKPGAFGIAFEQLSGDDQISLGGGDLELRIPALAIRLFLIGDVPWLSFGGSKASIGGSFGFLKASGDLKLNYEKLNDMDMLEPTEETNDLSSTNLYMDLYFLNRFDFSAKLGLVAQIGYRGSPVVDATIATEGMEGDIKVDYSGIFYRLGLRFTP